MSKYTSEYLHFINRTEENMYHVEENKNIPQHVMQDFNSGFEYSNLVRIPELNWLKDVQVNLVSKEKFKSLIDDFFPYFSSRVNKIQDGVLNSSQDIGVISVDLETTSLAKMVRFKGGQSEVSNKIVGICLGVSSYEGFYIPLMHNGRDGVENYDYEEAIEFLNRLQIFFCVYHDSSFDRELLETNGVSLNPQYADTMLLAINMDYRNLFFRVGLKVLSEKILGRNMLEIKDLSSDKSFIPMIYYPAKTLLVYGVSDAVNTFYLFEKFLKSERNPYKLNRLSMNLDHEANDYSRWMLRIGLPLNYEKLLLSLRTLIRRRLILEEDFQRIYDTKVSLSKSEKIGILIGDELKKRFFDYYKSKSDISDYDLFEKFKNLMFVLFKMEVKTEKLKSGIIKITYSTGVDVLTCFNEIRDKKITWLDSEYKDKLINMSLIIGIYRTVAHDMASLMTMYRYAYTDDFNYTRVGVGLKFNGTITNRFSNMKGKGSLERYSINRGSKGVKLSYKKEDPTCGINVQGINSSSIELGKALRVVKAPDYIWDKKKELDNKVEIYLRDFLESM